MATLKLPFSSFSNGRLARLPGDSQGAGWSGLPFASGRVLALRQQNPYWFAPARYNDASEIATNDRVAFALVKSKEGWALWLALPGSAHRCQFEARDGQAGIAWTRDGNGSADTEPLVYTCSGTEAHVLVEQAVRDLESVMPFHRSRTHKPESAFMSGLGWCTWDAFYHDVSAKGVAAGLRSFKRAGVKLQFVVLDDGWQDVNGWSLNSTGTNAKFPKGLSEIARAVHDAGIPNFGVWHTLHGYWHGVDPKGEIAQKYRVSIVPQTTRDFENWPDFLNPKERHALHPDDAASFYAEFYTRLAAQGVDFTKVDSQATTPYFAGDVFSATRCFTAFQAAYQGAASVYMRSGGIHCMANSPDILWRHAVGTVWRNSDDFYPKKPFSAQADHVYWNTLNALFTRAFVVPDWDMFQTTHATAEMHGAARALSGGPIYVSDKPGRHNLRLLRRLVRADGTTPRFPRPARPVERLILADPRREAEPLAIVNESGGVGQVALINCLHEPAPAAIQAKWSARDVLPRLRANAPVVLHDPISGTLVRTTAGRAHTESLAAEGGTRVWTVSPVVGAGVAALGAPGLYSAAAAIESVETSADGSVAIAHRLGGQMQAWCHARPKSVECEGKRIAFRFDRRTGVVAYRVPARGGRVAVHT